MAFLLGLVSWAAGLPQARAQATGPAPMVRVSGTVSDARSKQLLPGATVRVQRTRRGVAADAQGNFLLAALPTDTLLVRALGYKPRLVLLHATTLAQLVVQVRLLRDSVQLGEVRVTADRADRVSINRALRNLKKPAPVVTKGPVKFKPKPLFAVDSTLPKALAPTLATSNVDWVYDKLSRAGKEQRKLKAAKAKDAQAQALRRRQEYNKAFKDNRGYE